MSILFLLQTTPEEREAIQRVLEHAHRPENLYVPGPDVPVPGDDPRHVVVVGLYRCVFSRMHYEGELYRFLTVSSPQTYPPHVAIEWLASLFGFVGRPFTDWQAEPNEQSRCISVAQRLQTAPINHPIHN